MSRSLIWFACYMVLLGTWDWSLPGGQRSANADDLPTSPAEKYLHSGAWGEGETAMLLHLDQHPHDDEARFGLGVIQFFRALENAGYALYEYGADSQVMLSSLPRLPVPKNDQPSTVSFRELQRVAEVLLADLARAEATLVGIKDENVKLKIRLAEITFDFSRKGQQRVTLADLLKQLNNNRPLLPPANPELRIHFDRGDVAWLRAYCHVMSATLELSLALELESDFARWGSRAFPKVETSVADANRADWIKLADPTRLRRMRNHLVAVCQLNRETWRFIRQETDDDFEWLSGPKQQDQLGLPMTDAQIDAWLRGIEQVEGLFTGQRLLPAEFISYIDSKVPEGMGLNLRKLLDDPPHDLGNWVRIQETGIAPKYLDPVEGRPQLDPSAFFNVITLFSGPFGFARAARMN